MSHSIHLKMDKSKLLDKTKHQQYQMIIGICQWIVHVGQINILYATAFLSRFSSALKRNHLKIAEKILGYLKKFPAQELMINPRVSTFNTDNYEQSCMTEDFGLQY